MRFPFFFILLIFSCSLNAEELSAVITYDTQVITAEGVAKTTHFKDLFIRDDHNVWTQRIVPANAQHEDPQKEHEHHKEEHNLNFALAGKWIALTANNTAEYRLVRKDEKKIIEPRPTEYATLGYDGDWKTAYHLINPSDLSKLQISNRKSPAGTQWYTQTSKNGSYAVLWDNNKQFPLQIEQQAKNGSSKTSIHINYQKSPLVAPWKSLNGFQSIAYEDLLD